MLWLCVVLFNIHIHTVLVTEELPVDASLGSPGDSNSANELEKADMRIVESSAKDVCAP